jgi:hypothetical protein
MFRYFFLTALLLINFTFAEDIIHPVISNVPRFEKPENKTANELAQLDQMIELTRMTLETEIQLREKIKHYQALQDSTMRSNPDNEQLYQLAKNAHAILEIIRANHLNAAFEEDFLRELGVVSKLAAKQGIPKP